MGQRGKGAHVTRRAPSKNTLANAGTRARRALGGEVVEGSPAFMDLVVSPERGGRRFWADPLHDGRRAAWEHWRDRILGQWYSKPFRYGERPAAWWDFDLPGLAEKAGIGARKLAGMTHMEIVHAVTGNPAERATIEARWRRYICHAFNAARASDRTWREHATRSWRVPAWFFDQNASTVLDGAE
jgi:hypothetical protein